MYAPGEDAERADGPFPHALRAATLRVDMRCYVFFTQKYAQMLCNVLTDDSPESLHLSGNHSLAIAFAITVCTSIYHSPEHFSSKNTRNVSTSACSTAHRSKAQLMCERPIKVNGVILKRNLGISLHYTSETVYGCSTLFCDAWSVRPKVTSPAAEHLHCCFCNCNNILSHRG